VETRDLLAFSVSTLCRGVDVKSLAALLAQAPCRVESRAAGELVLLAGIRYDELRVLLEGSVSADMQSPGGKLLTIETIKAPDPIASAILFAPQQALPVTVTAATDCRLLVLPLEVVLDLCRADRRFLINFLTEIGGKLSLLADKFRLLEFSSLRQRIIAYLAPRFSAGSLTLECSKEKVAEFLSVARPSLSRELSALAAEGILAVRGRRIRVLDQEKFDRLTAEKA
jgi:CRP-like cAMP-binding protein